MLDINDAEASVPERDASLHSAAESIRTTVNHGVAHALEGDRIYRFVKLRRKGDSAYSTHVCSVRMEVLEGCPDVEATYVPYHLS